MLPNRSLLESGNADLVYQQMIAPHLSDYMGALFKDVCRQYISLYWDEKLKVASKQVGAHWGSNLEIDRLTENIDETRFFGECKWWNQPVGENVLERLIQKAAKVPDQWKQNPRYILFSAGGFTNSLRQRASEAGVLLFELNDLFNGTSLSEETNSIQE